jgi:hypothetical protein
MAVKIYKTADRAEQGQKTVPTGQLRSTSGQVTPTPTGQTDLAGYSTNYGYQPADRLVTNMGNSAARNAAVLAGNNPAFDTSGITIDMGLQSQLAALQSALGVGGGSKKTGLTTGDARMAELKYKKEQDAAALARQQAANQALLDSFQNGTYLAGNEDIMNLINEMQTTGESGLQTQYENALTNIGGGYNAANQQINTGYGALQDYLNQNPNNPYEGMQATVGTASNPLEQFLTGYGAMTPDVQGQVAAEQLAGQQGGQAFNDLVGILNKQAQQGDMSRLAEAQMAQNMASTGLGQQRAGYESQAANQKQSGINALMGQIQQAQLQEKIRQQQAKQQIIDALTQAGIKIPGATGDTNTGENQYDLSGLANLDLGNIGLGFGTL